MRRRLLIFHPALAPYRLDLFNALAQRYFVRFVFLNRDVTYQTYDQAKLRRALSADITFLEAGFSFAGRQVRFGLSAEISSFKPDVVVTHEFSSTTLAVAARRSIRAVPHVVWTADNPRVIADEHPLRRIARRLVLSHIDGLIVYSDETAAHYRNNFRFVSPIGVCPNAQREEAVRAKLRDALARASGLMEQRKLVGRKVLLYVGRLVSEKRVDRVIDAFAAARRDQPRLTLVLVGNGPEASALKARATELGVDRDTIFAGHVEGEELYALFNCGSIFILTSEFETWGAVVNEALLAGLPAICSDRAGARVLIDGSNGEVVDASEHAQVTAAISRWLRKVTPIERSQFEQVRPSLMTQRFSDAVDGFSSVIDATADAGRCAM